MPKGHWFDALHTAVTREAPRRGLLGALLSLAAATRPAARPGEAKNKKRKRRKKDRPNRSPAPRCSDGACAAIPQWAGERNEIEYCETICRTCSRGGRGAFCIVRGSGGDPVARCCDIGEYCCDPGAGRLSVCLDTGLACCPDDVERGYCLTSSHRCCPGFGCVANAECPCPYGLARCGNRCLNTINDETNCGACGRTCTAAAPLCCNYDCVDPSSSEEHCGVCGRACVGPGRVCCDGDCKDTNRDEENCGGCGQTCVGPDLQCCGGACVNTRTDPEHCGGCFRGGPDYLCCDGREVYDPSQQFCCPDGGRACYFSQICCTNDAGNPACCPAP